MRNLDGAVKQVELAKERLKRELFKFALRKAEMERLRRGVIVTLDDMIKWIDKAKKV